MLIFIDTYYSSELIPICLVKQTLVVDFVLTSVSTCYHELSSILYMPSPVRVLESTSQNPPICWGLNGSELDLQSRVYKQKTVINTFITLNDCLEYFHPWIWHGVFCIPRLCWTWQICTKVALFASMVFFNLLFCRPHNEGFFTL